MSPNPDAPLDVSSVRKKIVVADEGAKSSSSIMVMIGMNNQIPVDTGGEKWPLSQVIKDAIRQLNLVKGRYLSSSQFLQNVFVDSQVVSSSDLGFLVSPGAIVTVDEKKSNG